MAHNPTTGTARLWPGDIDHTASPFLRASQTTWPQLEPNVKVGKNWGRRELSQGRYPLQES